MEEFQLPGAERIPPDSDAIIMAAPEGQMGRRELDAITAYLLQGGRLLAMVEPMGSAAFDSLLHNFGIIAEGGFVVDPSEERRNITGSGAFRIALAQGGNPEHPVTAGFSYATLYPIARSLSSVQPPPAGVAATRLISSMPNAWSESDMRLIAMGAPAFEEESDGGGPLGLAYAVELDLRRFLYDESMRPAGLTGLMMDFYPETFDVRSDTGDTLQVGDGEFVKERSDRARIVAVGDVDFVNNANLLAYGNSDLFVAMLLWLTEQESRIALAPRPELFDPVVLTIRQTFWMRIGFIAALPAVFFLLAMSVVWRRRNWV